MFESEALNLILGSLMILFVGWVGIKLLELFFNWQHSISAKNTKKDLCTKEFSNKKG